MSTCGIPGAVMGDRNGEMDRRQEALPWGSTEFGGHRRNETIVQKWAYVNKILKGDGIWMEGNKIRKGDGESTWE